MLTLRISDDVLLSLARVVFLERAEPCRLLLGAGHSVPVPLHEEVALAWSRGGGKGERTLRFRRTASLREFFSRPLYAPLPLYVSRFDEVGDGTASDQRDYCLWMLPPCADTLFSPSLLPRFDAAFALLTCSGAQEARPCHLFLEAPRQQLRRIGPALFQVVPRSLRCCACARHDDGSAVFVLFLSLLRCDADAASLIFVATGSAAATSPDCAEAQVESFWSTLRDLRLAFPALDVAALFASEARGDLEHEYVRGGRFTALSRQGDSGAPFVHPRGPSERPLLLRALNVQGVVVFSTSRGGKDADGLVTLPDGDRLRCLHKGSLATDLSLALALDAESLK